MRGRHSTAMPGLRNPAPVISASVRFTPPTPLSCTLPVTCSVPHSPTPLAPRQVATVPESHGLSLGGGTHRPSWALGNPSAASGGVYGMTTVLVVVSPHRCRTVAVLHSSGTLPQLCVVCTAYFAFSTPHTAIH